MFKMAMRMGGASSKKKPATEAGSAASAAGEARIPGCPADRDELGAGTWALMHALAANYPDAPTPADQARAADFFNGLAALYPCPHCAEDFQTNMAASPPRVVTREALVLWVCEQHNLVNVKLGKPTMECTIPALDERYKTGHSSCWE
jgi:FAD-linked sulfhydryl oxidase